MPNLFNLEALNGFMLEGLNPIRFRVSKDSDPEYVKSLCEDFQRGIVKTISLNDLALSKDAREMALSAIRVCELILRIKEKLGVEDVVWCNQIDMKFNKDGMTGFYQILFKGPNPHRAPS